jgi:hypothetical protein
MSDGVRARRWTRKEYDRLIEIGVFRPDESPELVVGEPQRSPHYTAIGLVGEALRAALGAGWLVRPHGPLALDEAGRRRRFPVRLAVRQCSAARCRCDSVTARRAAARVRVNDLLP